MKTETTTEVSNRKSKARAGETREKVLEAALTLFNQNGTATVTTNHIAEAAGLSVGNLYYHYRNKEEIIRALYERIARESDVIFSVPGDRPFTFSDLEGMLYDNYRMLWNYRFFYREMLALLQQDGQLAARYREVRERGFADFVGLVGYFTQSGVLRPIDDPVEIEHLASICWLVSEFYLPFLEAGGVTVAGEHQASGVALLRHVLKPYLKEETNL